MWRCFVAELQGIIRNLVSTIHHQTSALVTVGHHQVALSSKMAAMNQQQANVLVDLAENMRRFSQLQEDIMQNFMSNM